MPRIPLCLVTGFLGSGKTTFLQHTARRLAEQRIVYLVNEFSDLDIDTQVLRRIGPNTVSIPGGSIFCKCLVVSFLHHLTEVPKRWHSEQQPVAGVIVEASGIADPRVVADMLAETKLDQVYDLTSIVTIIDPGSVHKLLATLPNIYAQIASADTVLINKTDLFDEQKVTVTEAAVREINPHARQIRTVRAAADLDLFGAGPARPDLHGEYAACADPNYHRMQVTIRRVVDPAKLHIALAALGDAVYRAKGFVRTPAGMVYVDASTAGLRVEPAPHDGASPGLAMIVRPGSEPAVEALVANLAAGTCDA